MSVIRGVWNRIAEAAWIERQGAVLSLFEHDPDARFLDLGCGDGELTLKVAQAIGTDSIHAVDIVADNVSRARARGIEAHQSELNQDLPFADGAFDAVNASDIIEHLSHTDTFLREIHRVLRSDGYVVIMTPNLAALHNIFLLLGGKQPNCVCVSDEIHAGTWPHGDRHVDHEGQGTHLRVFTLGALEDLLDYHGFRVERSIGSVFQPLPAQLARIMCLLDKRHATCIIVKARKKREPQSISQGKNDGESVCRSHQA